MDQQEMTSSKRVMLEKWGPLAFVAFVFLLPLFVIPSSVVPFQAGKAMLIFLFTFVVFILWLIDRLRVGSVKIPWSLSYALGGFLVVVYFLSALLSSSSVVGLVGRGFELDTALSILSFVLLMFIVPQLFRTKQSIFNLYLGLFAAFFIVFLYAFIRLVAGPGVFTLNVLTTSASNLVGSWNDLGVFFGLITVLSLVMLEIAPPKGLLRIILYAGLVLSLVSLAVINFTAVWITVSLFSLALLVYLYAFSRSFTVQSGEDISGGRSRRLSRISLGVLIVSAVFAITGLSFVSGNNPSINIGSQISQSLGISQLEARPSWSTTSAVAEGALKDSPLLGSGPNQFVYEWVKYRPTIVNQSAFWNIDFNLGIGVIPSTLTSVGALGFFTWILFIAFFLYQGLRTLRRPREDLFLYYLSVTSFVGALFLWVMAIFYTTSTVPFALAFILTGAFMATLQLGGGMRERTFSFSEEPSIRFVALLLTIVLVISSLSALFWIGQRNVALAYYNKALAIYNSTGDLAKAETNVRRAITISGEDMFYRGLSEIALLNLNRVASQVNANTPVDQVRNQFQLLLGGAIASAQAARDANQADYQNWVSLARTYESVVPLKIPGAYENAQTAYGEAVKRNPTSPLLELTLARLAVLNGSNSAAKEYITNALQLKNNYTDAIFLLSQIEVAEGDIKSAITSVQSASVIAPNDPTVFFQLGFLEYNNRDYQKAAAALERAVALQSLYANARYFLGLSYDKLGKRDEAIKQFEEIAKTNPDNAEVKLILGNLKAGRGAFENVKPPLDNTPEKRKTPPISDTKDTNL